MSCIESWWNFQPGGDFDAAAWMYYDDYFLCDQYDLALESCGEDRGMRLTSGTGSTGFMFPTTNNPFYGMNPLAAYEIHFKINLIDYTPSSVSVGLFVDSHSTVQSPPMEIFVGGITGLTGEDSCQSVKIAITNPALIEELVSKEYLILKPFITGTHIVDAVIDEVTACTLLDIQFSSMTCGEICVELSADCESECDDERLNDPELDDCFMQVVWYDEEVLEVEECYFPYIGTASCCIDSLEFQTYEADIHLQYVLNGETVTATYFIEYEYGDCLTVTVDENETWDAGNTSASNRYELITVTEGDTLTIAEDLTLRFCEAGTMIINPGGVVMLNGTLTAECEDGWVGVEVQGDGTTHQYVTNGLPPQGVLHCNPGSKIEHAYNAVQLFGPYLEDSGGQLYAEGATFLNNRRSIEFAPYENYFPTPGKRRPYASRVRNCNFNVDDQFVWPYFNEHIRMHGVFRIALFGNHFRHDRMIASPEGSNEFGVGIVAIDAGFNVGGTATNPANEPCFPDECGRKSEFSGLEVGILAGRIGRNEPFQVYNAEFSNCFFGVWNQGVSGASFLFNQFSMGAIPDIPGEEDQIGIVLSGMLAGVTMEENEFVRTDDLNADHLLGVVAYETGDANNVIRRNVFTGMTVGNEAFGINSNLDFELPSGLRYLCNANTDVEMNDFYLPHPDTFYPVNTVNSLQALISLQGGPFKATGNTFASTGETLTSDFLNLGGDTINYYYNDETQEEIPDQYTGITPHNTDENPCPAFYCLHSCLDDEDLEDEIDEYYSNLADYTTFIDEEEWEDALSVRVRLDSNLFRLLRYFEYDTVDYDRDTLRAWYARSLSLAGVYILAGDYFADGEYSMMEETLDSIPVRFELTEEQAFDLGRVKEIYDMLSARSFDGLTSSDMDSLHLYSAFSGQSSVLARNILILLDTTYSPRYYIPGEIEPRSAEICKPSKKTFSPPFQVYPNPTSGVLTIEINEENQGRALFFRWYDMYGVPMGHLALKGGLNRVDLRSAGILTGCGLVFYTIYSAEENLATGKIIVVYP